MPVLLVKNKCDLPIEKIKADGNMDRLYQMKYNLSTLAASAKSTSGVNEAFVYLAEQLTDLKQTRVFAEEKSQQCCKIC